MNWLQRKRKEWTLRREAARHAHAFSLIAKRTGKYFQETQTGWGFTREGYIHRNHCYFSSFMTWDTEIGAVVEFLNACNRLWPIADKYAQELEEYDNRTRAEIDRLYQRLTDTPMTILVRPVEKP